jgi:GNAT superfamily N-acetyltransferase
MTVEIRSLTADEARMLAHELAALGTRSKGAWGYDDAFMERFGSQMGPWLEEFTAGMRDDGDRLVLVAEDDGTAVGFAILEQTDPQKPAWLEDLWIEPHRMRGGIGGQLLRAALDAARAAGRTALEFESDPNAEGFYLRMGARRIGEQASDFQAGRMLPVMRFELRT